MKVNPADLSEKDVEIIVAASNVMSAQYALQAAEKALYIEAFGEPEAPHEEPKELVMTDGATVVKGWYNPDDTYNAAMLRIDGKDRDAERREALRLAYLVHTMGGDND